MAEIDAIPNPLEATLNEWRQMQGPDKDSSARKDAPDDNKGSNDGTNDKKLAAEKELAEIEDSIASILGEISKTTNPAKIGELGAQLSWYKDKVSSLSAGSGVHIEFLARIEEALRQAKEAEEIARSDPSNASIFQDIQFASQQEKQNVLQLESLFKDIKSFLQDLDTNGKTGQNWLGLQALVNRQKKPGHPEAWTRENAAEYAGKNPAEFRQTMLDAETAKAIATNMRNDLVSKYHGMEVALMGMARAFGFNFQSTDELKKQLADIPEKKKTAPQRKLAEGLNSLQECQKLIDVKVKECDKLIDKCSLFEEVRRELAVSKPLETNFAPITKQERLDNFDKTINDPQVKIDIDPIVLASAREDIVKGAADLAVQSDKLAVQSAEQQAARDELSVVIRNDNSNAQDEAQDIADLLEMCEAVGVDTKKFNTIQGCYDEISKIIADPSAAASKDMNLEIQGLLRNAIDAQSPAANLTPAEMAIVASAGKVLAAGGVTLQANNLSPQISPMPGQNINAPGNQPSGIQY